MDIDFNKWTSKHQGLWSRKYSLRASKEHRPSCGRGRREILVLTKSQGSSKHVAAVGRLLKYRKITKTWFTHLAEKACLSKSNISPILESKSLAKQAGLLGSDCARLHDFHVLRLACSSDSWFSRFTCLRAWKLYCALDFSLLSITPTLPKLKLQIFQSSYPPYRSGDIDHYWITELMRLLLLWWRDEQQS